MGSTIALWLETDAVAAARAFAEVEALFATNEAALSRFRPESELSRLNQRAGQGFVPVSPLLWDVLTDALALARVTDGLFDPTLLAALEAAGYDRSFADLPDKHLARQAPPANPQLGCWAEVQVDPERQAVNLPSGVRIDLGGIAKGHTAAQAAGLLGQWGPCLIDAGGDLTAGAAPTGYRGWPVAVAAPWDDVGEMPEDLFALWLADASLATSGVDYRRWQHHDRPAHHLIDPHTGYPAATDLLSATVLMAEATDADAWATAAVIMGMAVATELLDAVEIAAVLSAVDGRVAVTPPMSLVARALPLGATLRVG
jgi:thiamine biosynthesis lipoprotein